MADFLFYMIFETAAYAVISSKILGFDKRKSRIKYLVFLYVLVGVYVVNKVNNIYPLYCLLWSFVFTYLYYNERVAKAVQAAIIEYILCGIVPILIWSIIINISNVDVEDIVLERIVDILNLFVFIAIAVIFRRRTTSIKEYFEMMSVKYFLLLFMMFFSMVIMVVCVKVSVSYRVSEQSVKNAMLASMFGMFFIIIMCIYMSYLICSKQKNAMENDMMLRCLELQKKYYDGLIVKDENIKEFRHDIKKHIVIMKNLSKNNKIDELKEYIETIIEDFNDTESEQTGNIIVDYFINDTIQKLRNKDLEYNITGRFMENIKVSNSDMCILFGNALENVYEALEKWEGKCRLDIVIKSYKDRTFVTISNSAEEKAEELLATSKSNKELHGYGISNMRSVVEKYDGEIKWEYNNGMFIVSIII